MTNIVSRHLEFDWIRNNLFHLFGILDWGKLVTHLCGHLCGHLCRVCASTQMCDKHGTSKFNLLNLTLKFPSLIYVGLIIRISLFSHLFYIPISDLCCLINW